MPAGKGLHHRAGEGLTVATPDAATAGLVRSTNAGDKVRYFITADLIETLNQGRPGGARACASRGRPPYAQRRRARHGPRAL